MSSGSESSGSAECLDEQAALRCLSGTFPERVEAHLERCADCRQLLLKLAQLKSKTNETEPPQPPHPPGTPGTPPKVGSKVDRYVVLEELGRGGMGVVMSAYDPVLDRKVALKLVKPSGLNPAGDASERLLEEAKTLARVTHPNVIQVHDAGRHEDQVFVAMAQVTGPTLRGWLQEKTRTPEAIVRLMRGAGEGLAAAHAAGVVHGDFKPENVLVDSAGRPLVTDFGLARWMRAPASTRLSGTPGYIAPEQYAGHPASEQSDQFAFCVTLYEALLGERPFTPGALTEGLKSMPAPQVPARLWRVRPILQRGLSAAPKERYNAMRALLSALQRRQQSGRKRWLVTALSAAVLLSVFITHRLTQPACAQGARTFERFWSRAQAEQLQATLLRQDDPYAKEAAQLVQRKLARYRRSWIEANRRVCEEAKPQAKLKRACLMMIASEIGALSHSLQTADGPSLRRASSAVDGLTSVADCLNASFVTQFATNTPELKRVRQQLFEARETTHSGRFHESSVRLRAVLDEAKRLGMASLAADAALELAELEASRGRYLIAQQTLYEALYSAERAKHDLLRAQIMIELASVTGMDLSRHKEGYRWLKLAQAILEGRQDATDLQAFLVGVKGSLLLAEGKGEEAVIAMESALARQPVGHPQRHQTQLALGAAHGFLANNDKVLEYYEQSLQGTVQDLGSEHPQTATVLCALADYHYSTTADHAKATKSYEKALSIWEAAGVQDARVALTWSALGQLALDQDNFKKAALYLERSHELRKKLYTGPHPDLAASQMEQADLHSSMGDHARAAQHARAGVAMYEGALRS